MALHTEYVQFFKKWFSDDHPIAGVKANATLSIAGVVSDGETCTIGTNVYEFDINNTFTSGRIQVDVADLRNQATSTLTFGGIPVVTQTVTIGSGEDEEVYEFVADAEDIADPSYIPVALGETLTADNAVTQLALAINTNSNLVTAVEDIDDDTVVVTSNVRGTTGNSIVTAENCTNASWTGETLAGGLDTITATNAALALTEAINANETLVTATKVNDTVVVKYMYVGTEGNNVTVSENMTNGSWGESVTKLSNGVYATPVKCSAFIIINNVWWIADHPVNKYTEGGWKSATPS